MWRTKKENKMSKQKAVYVSEGRVQELGDENPLTPLEKDLSIFYEKFHRKGKSVDSTNDSLIYKNVPLGLAEDFKGACEQIIKENNLNLKAEVFSENGVFLN